MNKPLKQHQPVRTSLGDGIVTLVHFSVAGKPHKYTIKLKDGDEQPFDRCDIEEME